MMKLRIRDSVPLEDSHDLAGQRALSPLRPSLANLAIPRWAQDGAA